MKRRVGRPKGEAAVVVNVRIPMSIVQRLDRYLDKLETETGLAISFAPYAARGRAYSGSSSFSASSGMNRGMGKIPASWRASRQASATSS
jgi:hypothetical protein